MRRLVAGLFLMLALAAPAAHVGMNAPTWNREISRLVYDRCASCHREEGAAFSLMTYRDAQPHAAAIKDAVLSRRMPPWGAVKGFGDFQNDRALAQHQIELVSEWVEGGAPRGNNPGVLPDPPQFDMPQPEPQPTGRRRVTRGTLTLDRPIVLDGLLPDSVPEGASMQIVAVLPDGRVDPLLWLYQYQSRHRHPFLLRRPLSLPAGTVIRGVTPPAGIQLLERAD